MECRISVAAKAKPASVFCIIGFAGEVGNGARSPDVAVSSAIRLDCTGAGGGLWPADCAPGRALGAVLNTNEIFSVWVTGFA